MPQSLTNRSSHKINKDIEELERDISTTEYYCKRTVNDIKSKIKRLKGLRKPKPPPPDTPQDPRPKSPSLDTLTTDRMVKRLQERKDTLQLLKSMGEDTKVVEDEIHDIQKYLKSSQGKVSLVDEYSPDDLPLLKVLFFDLDDTILTSADPVLNVTRVRKELIKLGSVNNAPQGRPENLSDTITTKDIVQLLKYCTRRDDIKWFIISQGENIEKVEQLFANYVGEIYPDNEDFGVSMFNHNNKRKSIENILIKLDKSFYIPEAIFVDDIKENTKLVSKIKGVSVIDIPGRTFNVSWLSITLMTKKNCDDIMNYLSGSRGASKRTKKKKKSINTKKGRSKKVGIRRINKLF